MRIVAIGLLVLVLAVAGCDAGEQRSEAPEAPVVPAAITYDGADAPNRTALLAHGERMSWMLGCKGCHGENLQGKNVTEKEPEFGDMNAPNITLMMGDYSDADLDNVIRRGIPKDRREFWFMASESFQYVSDADLRALIAFLRTVPPAGKQMPPIRKGPAFHDQVKKGDLLSAQKLVQKFKASTPPDLGETHKLGRYIAMTVCTECHNSELQGYEGFSPSLDVVGAYSNPELEHLLRTGEGKVKKDLGLMSQTARNRFSKLTQREMDAIIGYMRARVDRPQ